MRPANPLEFCRTFSWKVGVMRGQFFEVYANSVANLNLFIRPRKFFQCPNSKKPANPLEFCRTFSWKAGAMRGQFFESSTLSESNTVKNPTRVKQWQNVLRLNQKLWRIQRGRSNLAITKCILFWARSSIWWPVSSSESSKIPKMYPAGIEPNLVRPHRVESRGLTAKPFLSEHPQDT